VVEKFIPPQKGRTHILRVIRELLDFRPRRSESSLDEPLRFVTNAIKKRGIVFIISDFLLPDFEKPLRIASGKHDIVAIRVFDKAETEIPDIGFIKARDPESGMEKWIDTSSYANRKAYADWWKNQSENVKNTFRRCGIDHTDIGTDQDYVKPLINLFKRR
jgi:uncharacterized protein (DUF58 family)